jgi:hypothetical protein
MNEEDYQRRIAELEQQLQELNNRYQYLEEQFRIAQQKQFGKSTEGHPGQGELFNECMFRPIPITHFGSIRSLISV